MKNAIGVLGVIVIAGICAMPVIKLSILTLSYKLTSLIIQPIAENKITSLVEQMGDIFKIFLAIIIVLRSNASYRNNIST